MNPGIDYYMTSGLPATGKITFLRMPNTQPASSATLTVTVGSNTYTWTPVGASSMQDFVGTTANQLAISLCAAINGQQNRTDITANTNPIKSHYAVYYNNVVQIIATVPGTGGNSLALSFTSSDSGCASVSAATLTGGTTAAGGGVASSNRTGLIVAGNASANTITQLSATSKPFTSMYVYGIKTFATQGSGQSVTALNAATVYIGEKGTDGVLYFSDPIPNSGYPVGYNVPGVQLDLQNFYLLAPTANDAAFVRYV